MRRSPAQRLAERVQRLLAGDSSVDSGGLDYEIGGWHVGIVAMGPAVGVALRELATRLDRQLLAVPRGERLVWGWLGGQRRLEIAEVERLLPIDAASEVSFAIGEPRQGLDGWRLTHSEAKAALEVMLRRPQPLTRGSDVILTAALLRDDVLVKSLMKTYLSPLEEEGQAGAAIRETLRAYFAAGLNAATAAAALGVDRHTVQRRLRKAEAALGRRIDSCHAELQVALRLEELGDAPSPELVPAVD
jgi:sugar diacid utilization regulator